MVSDTKRCIFIHIPKCAGTSVNRELSLDSVGFSGHSPLSAHLKYLKLGYFSFTFVRNPYDRTASAYRYFRKLKAGHRWYKRNKIISDAANSMTFLEFVNHITDFQKLMRREEGSFESGIHLQPFSYFLDTPAFPIDYVGRFENIQHDYFNILCRLGFPLKRLPKTNSTHQPNYRPLYVEETRNTVYNIYKEDIEQFNYSF